MSVATETSIWDALPRLYEELADHGKGFLWNNKNERGYSTSQCEVRTREALDGGTEYSAHVVIGPYGYLATAAGVRDAVMKAMNGALDMINSRTTGWHHS